jgi:hypothetical protein
MVIRLVTNNQALVTGGMAVSMNEAGDVELQISADTTKEPLPLSAAPLFGGFRWMLIS